jgi:hypothetical protein
MLILLGTHLYWIIYWMLLILILKVFNDYNNSKFVIVVKIKVVCLIIM